MPYRNRILSRLALLLLAAATAGFLLYHATHYVFVNFQVYPRSVQSLDLTGKRISISHYEQLCDKLPHCDITWDVPLSSGPQPNTARSLTLDTLTGGDVSALALFPYLQEIDAGRCSDYDSLAKLLRLYPELKVRYVVLLGEGCYSADSRQIQVRNVPQDQLNRLACLPRLESLVCTGGQEADALMRYCHDAGIDFSIRVGDRVFPEETANIRARDADAGQLSLLTLLPRLRRVHLIDPQADARDLLQLRQALPEVRVDWELELCGVLCSTRDKELDLSQGTVSLPEIRKKLSFFPDAETLYLGSSTIDNETLADFREELRSSIKVVWQVSLGRKLTARTDDTSFMPVREHVYYFNDEEAYNLRYCEDMVAIDIGHMSIHNIDFVRYMPNLTYLILAHTQLQHIDPISTCKKLKFLELDWSPLRDLSPLVGCTALEDLNLGMTYASFDPIKKMTWLKNLWMVNCSSGAAYQMRMALPNTRVQSSGSATVASGWRRLPNYYAMRDALDMYYMYWD